MVTGIRNCWLLGARLVAGWRGGVSQPPPKPDQAGASGLCFGQVVGQLLERQECGAADISFLAPPALRAALRSLFSLAAGSSELIMMRECKCQRDPSFNLSC